MGASMDQPKGFLGIFKTTTRIIRENLKLFFWISVSLFLAFCLLTVFAPAQDKGKLWKDLWSHSRWIFNSTTSTVHQTGKNSDAPAAADGQLPPPFQPQHVSPWYFLLSVSVELFIKFVVLPPLSISICRGFLRKNLSLKAVIHSIPKTFKGILLTYVCFIAVFIGAWVLFMILILVPVIVLAVFKISPAIPLAVFVFAGIGGMMCLLTVWQLAYTVTILEEIWGWAALRRSACLLKGRKGIGFSLIVLFVLCFSFVNFVPTPNSKQTPAIARFSIAVLSIFLSTFLSLYQFSTTAVLYISCKLHHNEPIETLPAVIGYIGDDQTLSKYTDLNSFEHTKLVQDMNV